MEIDRLKSKLWVQAQVRICNSSNLAVYITKKGDPDAGAIALRLNKLNGTNMIYRQVRIDSRELAWSPAGNGKALSDCESNSYLEKQVRLDPDLWIVEIEDPNDKYKFTESLL